MIARLRLAWRLQRWEIGFVAAACVALSTAAFWQAADMRSRLTGCGTLEAAQACGFIFPFQGSHGTGVQLTQMAIAFVPFVAGLILGVPVVAREVEHRTALIAWVLSGSRVRWLAWRLAPMLVVYLALVGILAVAAGQLAGAYFPNSDLGFVEYPNRGVPLVMRSALMLVSGVAIGAMLGRVLPALLVGIGVAVALSMAMNLALSHWVPSAQLSAAESVLSGPGPITTDVQYRTPDGRLVDAQTGEALVEAAYEVNPGTEQDPSTLPQEDFFGIAASRYPDVVVRETAALGVAIIIIAALSAIAVGRRRPE